MFTPRHDPSPSPAPFRWWAGLNGALAFLFARGDATDDARLGAAAAWITPLGLVVGLAWAATFKVVWRVYGEIGNVRVIPGLSVVLLDCLLISPILVFGLARTAHRLFTRLSVASTRDSASTPASFQPAGTLILVLYVLSLWVLVTSIPAATAWWPGPQDWRHPLRHFYPAPIYRPLVLAPLWGYWSMLLAATLGRTAPEADRLTVSLCQSLRPGRLLRFALLPFVLTSIYLSRDGNYLIGAVIGVALFGLLSVVCVISARIGNGQTRDTLGAAGAFGQLTFLTLYRAFWPIIHP